MKVYGLGLKGEQVAVRYLRRKGWKILERNFQCRFGELDIIAKEKSCLVFCEVKARSEGMVAAPQESVTYTKQQKLIKTAQYWLQTHEEDCPMRFDVVAITVDAKGHCTVEHLENVIEL